MDINIDGRLSPNDADLEFRIRQLLEFWNKLRIFEEIGQASWEALDSLERDVTECIQRRTPRDISRAESLTALALILIRGSRNL